MELDVVPFDPFLVTESTNGNTECLQTDVPRRPASTSLVPCAPLALSGAQVVAHHRECVQSVPTA